MSSNGRPYRTVHYEDFEILIGRSASDNDRLSLRVAAPKDAWLHVGGGTPGSHVVVRNPDGVDIPRSVLRRAAELAAWYSKARGLPKVEIHLCRAADVSKPRGAPAGQVSIRRFTKLYAIPRAATPDESEGL